LVRSDALVYFVVVNFNGRSVLGDCLDSLCRQEHSNFKILLVDNNSTDDSIDLVKKKYPEINLLQLDKNYGFARANNLALDKVWDSNPDFVAFINNDVVLERDWLSSVLRFMTDSPFSIVQTLIVQFKTNHIIDSAGIGISAHLKIYDRKSGEPLESEKSNRSIFGACLAAAVFTRGVLEILKADEAFLDENFHTFYEDVDVCFRANSAGFKAGLLARPLCKHLRSYSADMHPFRKYFFIARNYFLVLRKHIPSGMIIKSFFWIKWDRIRMLVRTLFHPVFFFGFLFGSIVGSMSLFRTRKFTPHPDSKKRAVQMKMLDEIKKGLYE